MRKKPCAPAWTPEASSVGSGYLQQSSECAPDKAFPAWANVALWLCSEIKPAQIPGMDGLGEGLTTPSPTWAALGNWWLPGEGESVLFRDAAPERRWSCTRLMMGTPSGLGGFKQTNQPKPASAPWNWDRNTSALVRTDVHTYTSHIHTPYTHALMYTHTLHTQTHIHFPSTGKNLNFRRCFLRWLGLELEIWDT